MTIIVKKPDDRRRDNWSGRWEAKVAASKAGIDWENFRRNSTLMLGIDSKVSKFELFYKRCKEAKLLPRLYEDPGFGNPTNGKIVGGVFATSNSLRHACMVNKLISSPLYSPVKTVWEIGAGYGSFAVALSKVEKIESYYLSDHPIHLEIQTKFITTTTKIPTKDYQGEEVDLVVNTNSLAEMLEEEVKHYFDQIQSLPDGSLFFTINRKFRDFNFSRFPYDKYWDHDVCNHYNDSRWIQCVSKRNRQASSEHPLNILEGSL